MGLPNTQVEVEVMLSIALGKTIAGDHQNYSYEERELQAYQVSHL